MSARKVLGTAALWRLLPLVLALSAAGLGGCGGPAGGPTSAAMGPAGAATGGAGATGIAARAGAEGAGEERPAAEVFREVRLVEAGGRGPQAPWSIQPGHLEVPLGKVVALRVTSAPENRTGHSLVVGPPYNLRSCTIPPGGSTWLVFRADRPGEAIPLECGIAGHPQLGMAGTLTVR